MGPAEAFEGTEPQALAEQEIACFLCAIDLVNPERRFRFPDDLREASGLSVSAEGLVFVHNDEFADVKGFDLAQGVVMEEIRIARRNIFSDGDFEGVAVLPNKIVLLRSDGHLLFATRAHHAEYPKVEAFELGLAREFEFEGLAYNPGKRSLLLAVKTIYDKKDPRGLVILVWSLDEMKLTEVEISISKKALKTRLGHKHFRTSGITYDETSGHYILVSAIDQLLLEITAEGEIIAERRLPKGLHRQAEGIAILRSSGTPLLLIADESDKKGGVMTIYGRALGL